MGVSSWLEVSLIVDGEMAEAVSEVMSRFVSGGVVIESTSILADAEDEGRTFGPLRVCGYIPLDNDWQKKRSQLEEAFWQSLAQPPQSRRAQASAQRNPGHHAGGNC